MLGGQAYAILCPRKQVAAESVSVADTNMAGTLGL